MLRSGKVKEKNAPETPKDVVPEKAMTPDLTAQGESATDVLEARSHSQGFSYFNQFHSSVCPEEHEMTEDDAVSLQRFSNASNIPSASTRGTQRAEKGKRKSTERVVGPINLSPSATGNRTENSDAFDGQPDKPSLSRPWPRPSCEEESVADADAASRRRKRSNKSGTSERADVAKRARIVVAGGDATDEEHSTFFHHLESLLPLRVRIGVVPLPGAQAAGLLPHKQPDTRQNDGMESQRVTFVERFVSPREFFQLPVHGREEGVTDIIGWSGVYPEVPVQLPAAQSGGQETTLKGAASVTVVLSPY